MTEPIVPPYLVARARVSVILTREIQHAYQQQNSPLQAVLEALRDEILAALDPISEDGDSQAG